MIFLGVLWVTSSGSEVVLECIGRQPLKELDEQEPRQARATPASRGFQTLGPAGACPMLPRSAARWGENKNPQRGRLREIACRAIPESHVGAKQRNKGSRSRAKQVPKEQHP
jgi:hypothetical protein